jgi:hypothetical protein
MAIGIRLEFLVHVKSQDAKPAFTDLQSEARQFPFVGLPPTFRFYTIDRITTLVRNYPCLQACAGSRHSTTEAKSTGAHNQ